MRDSKPEEQSSAVGWRSKKAIALGMLVLIALFYVWREHYEHLAQIWPYALLLLCPLMHLFGHQHGGHGHAHRHEERAPKDDQGA
ncbi:Protein of unknown function [Atopomonas hussainii]|uniref:DUF2933 domain-containing protein n=1 Tax=Atopomonas hussainii TaxID=1429083 RepID=A0A1H7KMM3_9GAMM|nr:DUF2933 domain-containing protein [Atopomonas hussainii]SEK88008.1 Protein of unknown function [Atopomonas hussainii]